jgi:hypothetical protein
MPCHCPEAAPDCGGSVNVRGVECSKIVAMTCGHKPAAAATRTDWNEWLLSEASRRRNLTDKGGPGLGKTAALAAVPSPS